MSRISFDIPREYDLFVAGDFCPYAETANSSLTIGSSLKEILSHAQEISVNLECPVTDHKHAIIKTGPALKAPVSSVQILKDLGIDLCNLANNHIMDYGSQGAKDTMSMLQKAGIEYLGISEAEDIPVLVKEINGKRIAFVSFTENEFSTLEYNKLKATPMDYYLQMRQLHKARELADFVVVQYHGGAEQYPYPSPGQKKYAHYLADLGASIVICHHSHCVSGYEIYNDVPVFYGLGNFYFPEAGNSAAWYSGLGLCITFKEFVEASIVPLGYSITEGTLDVLKTDPVVFAHEMQQINSVIGSDDLLSKTWIEFCAGSENAILSGVFSSSRVTRALLKRGLLKNYLRRKVTLGLLNTLRCETHLEKLVSILKRVLYG